MGAAQPKRIDRAAPWLHRVKQGKLCTAAAPVAKRRRGFSSRQHAGDTFIADLVGGDARWERHRLRAAAMVSAKATMIAALGIALPLPLRNKPH